MSPFCAKFGAILLPNLGGWAGSYITKSNLKPWYENLNKPNWRPPNMAFGPIWTGLYCGMGYASYLVYRTGGGFEGPAKVPLILYGTQLALNWSWTPVFFGYHSLKWSLINMNLLYINVAACGIAFYQVNKTAGYLFIPYILWLTLATALNYVVYRDNNNDNSNSEQIIKKIK